VLGPAIDKTQDELLTILIEECSEVIKAATKIKRFGLVKTKKYDNAADLAREIGEMSWVIKLIVDTGIITNTTITQGYDNKRIKLREYLVENLPLGL
jgi:NTP pyrophosphatase (non-canonical NTP hydrolase)